MQRAEGIRSDDLPDGGGSYHNPIDPDGTISIVNYSRYLETKSGWGRICDFDPEIVLLMDAAIEKFDSAGAYEGPRGSWYWFTAVVDRYVGLPADSGPEHHGIDMPPLPHLREEKLLFVAANLLKKFLQRVDASDFDEYKRWILDYAHDQHDEIQIAVATVLQIAPDAAVQPYSGGPNLHGVGMNWNSYSGGPELVINDTVKDMEDPDNYPEPWKFGLDHFQFFKEYLEQNVGGGERGIESLIRLIQNPNNQIFFLLDRVNRPVAGCILQERAKNVYALRMAYVKEPYEGTGGLLQQYLFRDLPKSARVVGIVYPDVPALGRYVEHDGAVGESIVENSKGEPCIFLRVTRPGEKISSRDLTEHQIKAAVSVDDIPEDIEVLKVDSPDQLLALCEGQFSKGNMLSRVIVSGRKKEDMYPLHIVFERPDFYSRVKSRCFLFMSRARAKLQAILKSEN